MFVNIDFDFLTILSHKNETEKRIIKFMIGFNTTQHKNSKIDDTGKMIMLTILMNSKHRDK